MRRAWAAFVAMGLVAAADAPAAEHLAPPADPAFRLGFAADGATPIREWVPRGESVEAWTRMVTVQRIAYRPGLSPRAFAERFAVGLSRACPGAAVGPITDASVAGHAAVDIAIDCPRNPQTGKPESLRARVLLGDESMHMVQAAARRAFDAADTAWATRVTAGAGLCAATATAARCRAPTAVGTPL